MDLEACKREIRQNFYHWALRDARREAVEDFRLVRQVRNASVLIFLDMMARLPKGQRVGIAELLVKRIHHQAAEAAAEGLTPDETRLIEDWVQERGDRIAREGFLKGQELSHGKPFKADRRRLATLVKELLTPFCGPSNSWSGKNDWRYQKPFGVWSLETFVDVGGRVHQLSYGHSLTLNQGVVLEHVSLLSWLGISGQTHWNLVTEADERAAADSLESICRHFTEVAPTLVAGVSVRVAD